MARPHDPSGFCLVFNHARDWLTALSHSGPPPVSRSRSRRAASSRGSARPPAPSAPCSARPRSPSSRRARLRSRRPKTRILRQDQPEAFGEVDARTADQVLANWEAIKKAERTEKQEDASALAGFELVRMADGSFIASRWGMFRNLDHIAAVEAWLARVVAKAA